MTKMVVMSPGTPAMSFIRKQMSNANIFFASCMIVTVCGPRLLNITDSDHAMLGYSLNHMGDTFMAKACPMALPTNRNSKQKRSSNNQSGAREKLLASRQRQLDNVIEIQ